MTGPHLLVTITGEDRPGVAAAVFAALEPLGCQVADVEQVEVHGRLLLGILLGAQVRDAQSVRSALGAVAAEGVEVQVRAITPQPRRPLSSRHHVAVLAPRLGAAELGAACGTIAAAGANIDRIFRLATYPVESYQMETSGGDAASLRQGLAAAAARHGFDVAVEAAGLGRRSQRLIVLDMDSTLVQGEAIDVLAAEAGVADEVAAITRAAMEGTLDFEGALRARVERLAGLEEAALARAGKALALAPGARTLVRTLQRVGYVVAIVSGGFIPLVAGIAGELGIDRFAANDLEAAGGRLTGRLAGPVVDRAGKAAALRRFAAEAGIPMARTVAVGDGANDLDMIAAAGLGIAFNAKPVVREAADAALSVPYLDAILYFLGISREEVEAAG